MAVATAPQQRVLRETWEDPPGLAGWLMTVDHKRIGVRYLVTAFGFFLAAGLLALAMRTQLARPELHLLSPEAFNQAFTVHGTTMIFLFATPMLSGFSNYFVPLLIGARDMAFPRLNALSYWIFLFSGLLLYSSLITGSAPDGGWFAYVPLTGAQFSPGRGLDYWFLGIIFLGISTTAGAINLIVTILKMRAPGLSIDRMPLFVWNVLITAFAIVFAIPPLTAGNVLAELDRKAGMHFYDPAAGGDPLLWQHLFWTFGHPDVYIIFLPAVGIVSTVVPALAGRPIAGYTFIVLATVATAVISFGVWVHHMFAVGLPELSLGFFGAASMAIVIPSGVQVVAWTATLWQGRPRLKPPLLFVLAFLITFTIGGVTGVMFAAVPFDWQATDSYFVVAHFHYVLIGGAVFPIFAGLYFWLPKITGRMLGERLSLWTFWAIFLGFNLTFFPMHITGLLGMPRRVYTYAPGLGWDGLNLLSTVGAYLLGFGVLLFLVDVWRSLRSSAPAGDNPWGAGTLEWSVTSPPPVYNFRALPVVASRDPLWDQEPGGIERIAVGVAARRETLETSVLDAQPAELLRMPGPTLVPLALAVGLALLFGGILWDLAAVAAAGALVAAAAIARWLWPGKEQAE